MKLTIELVPSTCWYVNLRSEISSDSWDRVRSATYSKADYKCEICGGVGEDYPVECHEIWSYDDENKIQKLDGLMALCPKCHMVKHIGLARVNKKYAAAIAHLMYVNNWSKFDAMHYIDKCFRTWSERSKHSWKLDLSWLDKELLYTKTNPFKQQNI